MPEPDESRCGVHKVIPQHRRNAPHHNFSILLLTPIGDKKQAAETPLFLSTNRQTVTTNRHVSRTSKRFAPSVHRIRSLVG